MTSITKTHKDLFPKPVVEMVEILNELYNAPEEMSLPIILAAINFPAQALANVNPIQWPSSPLSLNFVVLADTGGQKSTVMNAVTKAIEEFQDSRQEQFKKELTQYMVEKKKYDQEMKDVIKDGVTAAEPVEEPRQKPKSSALKRTMASFDADSDVVFEPAKQRQQAIPTVPETPVGNLLLVQKATLNGIIDVLKEMPFAGLFNPDAAEFFSSHAFQDKERGTEMIAALSKLYSGETVARQTGVKETNVYLAKRRFSMLVMLQQQLAGFLLNSQYNDQGFIPRLLVTQPPKSVMTRFDFSKANVDRKAHLHDRMIPFHSHIQSMLVQVFDNHQRALDDAKRDNPDAPVSNKQLILPRLNFDLDALPLLEQFGNDMLAACDDPANIAHRGYLRRTYENACRIAATFAVFDGLDTIPKHYTQGAIELMKWFTEQRLALEIDGDVSENRVVQAAWAVEKWFHKQAVANPNVPITKKRLTQSGPSVYIKADSKTRNDILNELIQRHIIVDGLIKGPSGKDVMVFALAGKVEQSEPESDEDD